jgi:hypothetical protein
MASSDSGTVQEYLAELPEDRRQIISNVRDTINEHLPEGFEEAMNWGMITWQVPLDTYPNTYNGKPLMYAALAAQKNYNSLYLMCLYTKGGTYDEDWLKKQFQDRDLKLNMGKSCVRFTDLDQLPLDIVTSIISDATADEYIQRYEQSRK